MPDVTVCLGIPTLNRGEFVATTIAQALAQSVRPTEIVVYDQGETDPGARDRIVREAQGIVRWMQGDRPSLTAARNQILAISDNLDKPNGALEAQKAIKKLQEELIHEQERRRAGAASTS